LSEKIWRRIHILFGSKFGGTQYSIQTTTDSHFLYTVLLKFDSYSFLYSMLIRKVDSKHGFIVLTKNKCLTYVAPKYKKRKADGKDG